MDVVSSIADVCLAAAIVAQVLVVGNLIKRIEQWDEWFRRKELTFNANEVNVVLPRKEEKPKGNA